MRSTWSSIAVEPGDVEHHSICAVYNGVGHVDKLRDGAGFPWCCGPLPESPMRWELTGALLSVDRREVDHEMAHAAVNDELHGFGLHVWWVRARPLTESLGVVVGGSADHERRASGVGPGLLERLACDDAVAMNLSERYGYELGCINEICHALWQPITLPSYMSDALCVRSIAMRGKGDDVAAHGSALFNAGNERTIAIRNECCAGQEECVHLLVRRDVQRDIDGFRYIDCDRPRAGNERECESGHMRSYDADLQQPVVVDLAIQRTLAESEQFCSLATVSLGAA